MRLDYLAEYLEGLAPGMVATCRLLLTVIVLSGLLMQPGVHAQDPSSQPPRITFKSSVDLVSIAAVVRDRKGRFVRDLKANDFVIREGTERREVVEFHADSDAPVRVALLFDVSGSMRVASLVEEARQAARHVLGALRLVAPGRMTDEAAVFSFDMNLQSLQPFTTDPGAIESALSRVVPYGQTSLYDAIAQTAQRVADVPPGDLHRRAVIVLTDGIDTSSLMKPEEVSALASGIDVPVYVLTVVSPLDHPGGPDAVDGARLAVDGPLRDLARWTGGDLFVTSAPAHESIAARVIVDELRHQYVLGFNSSPQKGWHPLDVHVKDRDWTVRARSGYIAGTRVGS
jgi:Ca-activated chloride channel homolog